MMLVEERTKALDAYLNGLTYDKKRREKSPNYPSNLAERTKQAASLLTMVNPSKEQIEAFRAYVPGTWMLEGAVDERHLNVGIETLSNEVDVMLENYINYAKSNEGPNLHLS